MIYPPPSSPNRKPSLPNHALALLFCAGFVYSTALCNAQDGPTLYYHWRSGADAYDTLTLTVGVAVDADTPNGVYSIRSQQSTTGSNFANHVFTVTDGVATPNSFTVSSYPLFGSGPTGILLWVNDEPTNEFAAVSETYHYVDGGNEPDYFGHHSNPQVNYVDSLVFNLDASAFGESGIGNVQTVPEPATWISGVLTAAAAVVTAHRRRRNR